MLSNNTDHKVALYFGRFLGSLEKNQGSTKSLGTDSSTNQNTNGVQALKYLEVLLYVRRTKSIENMPFRIMICMNA